MEILENSLRERYKNNKLIETLDVPYFMVDDKTTPWLKVGINNYQMNNEALDCLLKIIKFPGKYYERLLAVEEFQLAESNVNFWADQMGLSFLLQDGVISQIFENKKIYVPGILIHDIVKQYLDINYVLDYQLHSWGYMANYISTSKYDADREYKCGVGVIFNEIFASPPRFDGILYSEKDNFYWRIPTPNRRFQAVGHDEDQIFDQAKEFMGLSLGELNELFVNFIDDRKVDYTLLIENIGLNLNIKQSLIDELKIISTPVNLFSEAMRALQSKLGAYEPNLRRNIEITATMFALAAQ